MLPSQDLVKQLKPQYFWDVDRKIMDDNNAKRMIIERVFCLGTLKEIALIINHYGKEEIINVVCRLNYLDPKTLNFISKFFHLPKKKFACYTRSQSHQQYWTL
jgi:hypothetical protein